MAGTVYDLPFEQINFRNKLHDETTKVLLGEGAFAKVYVIVTASSNNERQDQKNTRAAGDRLGFV